VLKKIELPFCYGGQCGLLVFLSLPTMSSASCRGTSCSFATERIALLESRIQNYAQIQAATAKHGSVFDARIVSDDLRLLERKIKEASMRVEALKPCIK
jgi:hypothetical protein